MKINVLYLKIIRGERSQEEFAKLIGTTQPTISLIEKRGACNAITFNKIVKATGCDPEKLAREV